MLCRAHRSPLPDDCRKVSRRALDNSRIVGHPVCTKDALRLGVSAWNLPTLLRRPCSSLLALASVYPLSVSPSPLLLPPLILSLPCLPPPVLLPLEECRHVESAVALPECRARPRSLRASLRRGVDGLVGPGRADGLARWRRRRRLQPRASGRRLVLRADGRRRAWRLPTVPG